MTKRVDLNSIGRSCNNGAMMSIVKFEKNDFISEEPVSEGKNVLKFELN